MSTTDWTDTIANIIQKAAIPFFAILAIATAGGIGYHFYNSQHLSKIQKSQDNLYAIRAELGKADEKLNPPDTTPVDPKKPGDKTADKKAEKPKASKEENQKAFSPIVEKLQAQVKADQGNQVAVEAALLVSDVTAKYDKYEEGITALQTALKDFDKKNFLYGIAYADLGNLLAKTDKCKEATEAWGKVIEQTQHAYLADSLRLKSGVCFEKMGQLDRAEKLYEDAISKNPNSTSAKTAKKFLMHVKYLKSQGGGAPAQQEANNG